MSQFRKTCIVIYLWLLTSAYISSALAMSRSTSTEPILPLPAKLTDSDESKIELGRLLFESKDLSANQTVSCSSCHSLTQGGVDGKKKSIGINGSVGDINAPTVFNSGFNFRQFWNGRAKTLEEQIDGPIQHPKEMGSKWEDVVKKISQNVDVKQRFAKIYSDGVTKENIKNAIAEFERSLVTPNSNFDKYLMGNDKAISELEKVGYQKFKSFGCVACHQGMNVGGNMFQTMGVMGSYFKERGTPVTEADLGRYNVTKEESDKYVFRVPSLRNVEITAPYFHDGSVKTLDVAVLTMAKFQLGRKLSKDDTAAIVAFLKTLTGETPLSLRGSR